MVVVRRAGVPRNQERDGQRGEGDQQDTPERQMQAMRKPGPTCRSVDGAYVSVKQPPAMPVRDGHPSAFQCKVVAQMAQNQRRCGFVPMIS